MEIWPPKYNPERTRRIQGIAFDGNLYNHYTYEVRLPDAGWLPVVHVMEPTEPEAKQPLGVSVTIIHTEADRPVGRTDQRIFTLDRPFGFHGGEHTLLMNDSLYTNTATLQKIGILFPDQIPPHPLDVLAIRDGLKTQYTNGDFSTPKLFTLKG